MGTESYYEFAENDYYGIKRSIDLDIFFSGMSSICQSICEKFLKYIISKYIKESDCAVPIKYSFIMRTHSLKNISNFITDNLKDFEINKRVIFQADGYYFSSIYPGKDSFIADKEDLLYCWEAVEYCKTIVDDYIANNK